MNQPGMPITSEIICQELARIETEHQVRILYAVESGSRAWGFASCDSDYDVRFIYLHPLEWYLGIEKRRDVIEKPVTGLLDLSGWDLQKALKLFKKSNPPLLEWLGSPIIYMDRYHCATRMRQLMQQNFSPFGCLYHYLHMAQGNYREYLRGEIVRVKKYFYVLRPVLACMWIEAHNTMPPTEFERLLDDADLPKILRQVIDDLKQRKMAGEELAMESRIEILNHFLDERITHFVNKTQKAKPGQIGINVLDRLFIEMLNEVWNENIKYSGVGAS